MKRILCFSALCLLPLTPTLRAQDAGSPNAAAAIASRQEAEENYNSLKGHIEDILAAQAAQAKEIQQLRRDIDDLRQQVSKPTGNYASQDDLKQLADSVQEIDKKRAADKELILKEMEKLGHIVAEPLPTHGSRHAADVSDTATTSTPTPAADQEGYYYIIKKNDTLSMVAQAYREQGIKVTSTQIAEANPNVNPAKLRVGQKIFIPAGKGSKAPGN